MKKYTITPEQMQHLLNLAQNTLVFSQALPIIKVLEEVIKQSEKDENS